MNASFLVRLGSLRPTKRSPISFIAPKLVAPTAPDKYEIGPNIESVNFPFPKVSANKFDAALCLKSEGKPDGSSKAPGKFLPVIWSMPLNLLN